VAQARLSVRKIREVLRLKSEARLSDRQIAAVLGSARSTMQECLRRARTAGLSWPLPDLDEDELHERLYPRTPSAPRYPTPDFERPSFDADIFSEAQLLTIELPRYLKILDGKYERRRRNIRHVPLPCDA